MPLADELATMVLVVALDGARVLCLESNSMTINKSERCSAIAAILSCMDADISAIEALLAKAHSIKQGMMQELLAGRIRLGVIE